MQKRVALDLFLLNRYGAFVDTFTSIFTNQMAYHVDFIDCFARGSYMVSHFTYMIIVVIHHPLSLCFVGIGNFFNSQVLLLSFCQFFLGTGLQE